MNTAPKPKPLPLSGAQRVLRVIGSVVLTACAVMVVLGVTVLKEKLHGPGFVIYWGWSFLLAISAIFLAVCDIVLVRRAFQRQRHELFREEFMTPELVAKLRNAIRHDEEKK